MPRSSTLVPYTTLFRSESGFRPAGRGFLRARCRAHQEHRGRDQSRRQGDRVLAEVQACHQPRSAKIDRVRALRLHLRGRQQPRSGEHTSELQSQSNLVCRVALHSFPTRRSSDLKAAFGRLVEDFSERDAEHIKNIEAETNHDVKAIEYWLKSKLATNREVRRSIEFVHFACTSEDVNNLDRESTRLNSSHSQISYAA